ncbi:MAG: serine/threonine protein kinase, partial [Myxococcales bacterium]|nr:serine/threonine protein kinase [Myxococcales bacterium]
MPARRDVGTRSDAGAQTLDVGRAQVTGDGATLAADEAEVTQRQRPRRPAKVSQGTASSRRARGDVVGRYVLLSALGEGGMGVVWAAYDPELDRRLALKLLRRGGSSERLLREAQALARLAHPNVVAIHDVGVDGGDVWLAMELVVGRTLEDWLAADPGRGWRELLKVLLPAGWGVAAAHEAGLIHRDLKPANLMIGDDGRARVMDFGLARAGDLEAEVSTVEESDPLASSQVSLLGSSVTRAGAILGTPAYMPPE